MKNLKKTCPSVAQSTVQPDGRHGMGQKTGCRVQQDGAVGRYEKS